MKFIVDAQLPKALANFLNSRNFDAIHTLDLPNKNATTDDEINEISFSEERIVISKDFDFYERYTRKKEPYKLLHLKTGNISTTDLIELFDKNLLLIINELNDYSVVELSRKTLKAIM